jgi:signal transduction histidine kinase
MKINTQLLLAFLVIALIPLGIISFLSYFNSKDALTSEVLHHLESVADIQESRVSGIVEQNLERLKLVSSRTQLRLSLDSYISNPNTADQYKINAILLDACASVKDFETISIITLDGIVVASTDEARIGAGYPDTEIFVKGQNENNADTFFLTEDGELSVYLNGPLYLEDRLLGVLVIESSADNIVTAIADYTGLGDTGETILATRNEDGDAVFLTPTRFEGEAALSLTVAEEERDIPIIQALSGKEAVLTDVVDYRGQTVLAVTRHVEGTGWGIVTKIDRDEALAPVAALQTFIITITLVSLALVVVVALYLTRVITSPIKKLTQATTRISQGDLSTPVDVKSANEIGVLAHSFNEMVASLRKSRDELKRWGEELEARVQQRTAELEQRSQELAEANVRLEELSRHKSQFLANMSHELRTPLNSIIGYTKLVLDGLEGEINEEQRQDLQTVYRNSQSLLALINDLLDLSKIEAGKVTVSNEAFTIAELLDEVLPSIRWLAGEKGLTLEHSVAPGIDHIYADRPKTKQTLINILANAVKFTSQGGIKLNVAEGDGEFIFSVSDTGMGIKKEDLEVIFDSFKQVGPAQVAGFEGTGLGLAISKQFIEMQGGRIWAESELGKGSTFTFTLPKKKAPRRRARPGGETNE